MGFSRIEANKIRRILKIIWDVRNNVLQCVLLGFHQGLTSQPCGVVMYMMPQTEKLGFLAVMQVVWDENLHMFRKLTEES